MLSSFSSGTTVPWLATLRGPDREEPGSGRHVKVALCRSVPAAAALKGMHPNRGGGRARAPSATTRRELEAPLATPEGVPGLVRQRSGPRRPGAGRRGQGAAKARGIENGGRARLGGARPRARAGDGGGAAVHPHQPQQLPRQAVAAGKQPSVPLHPPASVAHLPASVVRSVTEFLLICSREENGGKNPVVKMPSFKGERILEGFIEWKM